MDKIHVGKIIKVGSSHALILPVAILRAVEIQRGDYLIFAIYSDGILTARKLTPPEIIQMKPPEIKI